MIGNAKTSSEVIVGFLADARAAQGTGDVQGSESSKVKLKRFMGQVTDTGGSVHVLFKNAKHSSKPPTSSSTTP